MIYLIDTDHISLAHQGRSGVRGRIAALQSPDEAVISLVNRIEVLRGRFDAVTKAATAAELLTAQFRLAESETFLTTFRLIAYNRPAAELFERSRAAKWAKRMDCDDFLIATIALAYPATLVTRNGKDFAGIPGLRVENWAA